MLYVYYCLYDYYNLQLMLYLYYCYYYYYY